MDIYKYKSLEKFLRKKLEAGQEEIVIARDMLEEFVNGSKYEGEDEIKFMTEIRDILNSTLSKMSIR